MPGFPRTASAGQPRTWPTARSPPPTRIAALAITETDYWNVQGNGPTMSENGKHRSDARSGCGGERATLVRIGERPAPSHWKSPGELRGEPGAKDEFPGGVRDAER